MLLGTSACHLVPSFLLTRGGGWSQVLKLLHSFRWSPEAASWVSGVLWARADFLSFRLCPSALELPALPHTPPKQPVGSHQSPILAPCFVQPGQRGPFLKKGSEVTGPCPPPEVQPLVTLPLASYLPPSGFILAFTAPWWPSRGGGRLQEEEGPVGLGWNPLCTQLLVICMHIHQQPGQPDG